jgi:hypothetical protein
MREPSEAAQKLAWELWHKQTISVGPAEWQKLTAQRIDSALADLIEKADDYIFSASTEDSHALAGAIDPWRQKV